MLENERNHIRDCCKTVDFSSFDQEETGYVNKAVLKRRTVFLPLITHYSSAAWLTLGDGYGQDAYFLQKHGIAEVEATNLSTEILAAAHQRGLIKKFSAADINHLPYGDRSKDVVLCLMALHHLDRPYNGLYEMARTATKAFAIFEPNDPFTNPFFCIRNFFQRLVGKGTPQHSYEQHNTCGNYLFTVNPREMEKFAMSEQIEYMAVKTVNYTDSPEIGNKRVYRSMAIRLFIKNLLTPLKLDAPICTGIIFFRETPDATLLASLKSEHWSIKRLPVRKYG